MKQFLTPFFWFSLKGEMSSVSRYALMALIVLLIAALVYLHYSRNAWKKTLLRVTYAKAMSFLLVNSIIGLYLWFVTEQVVPVLSARIWFLFWFVEMIIWATFIYQEYGKIPEKKRQLEEKKDIKKYIP